MSASDNEVRGFFERHVSTVSKTAGGLVGVVAAIATGSPFAGAVVGPFMSDQFDRPLKELINRHMAPNQERRLALAMWYAKIYLGRKVAAGEKVRTDEFVKDREGSPSPANEVIEGALRAAMDSFEEAKARLHLGMLAANICLDRYSHIDPSTAVVAIAIADRLSYRGYLLLRALKNIDKLKLSARPESGGLKRTPRVSALLVELYGLYQLNLAGMAGEGNSCLAVLDAASISPKHMHLTDLGLVIHDLLGLDNINSSAEPMRAATQAILEASLSDVSPVVIDGGSAGPPNFMQLESAP